MPTLLFKSVSCGCRHVAEDFVTAITLVKNVNLLCEIRKFVVLESLGHHENDSSTFLFLVYDDITTWSDNIKLEKILLEFLKNRQAFLVKPLAMRKISDPGVLDILLEPSTPRPQ